MALINLGREIRTGKLGGRNPFNKIPPLPRNQANNSNYADAFREGMGLGGGTNRTNRTNRTEAAEVSNMPEPTVSDEDRTTEEVSSTLNQVDRVAQEALSKMTREKPSPQGPQKPQTKVDIDMSTTNTEEPKETEEAIKKYPKEEILPILDSILNNGYAVDYIDIRGIRVCFKTRFTWEEEASIRYVENADFALSIGVQKALAISLLAGSLVQYGTEVFDPINVGPKQDLQDSFDQRIEFVRALPAVIVDILCKKESEFGHKLNYIIANFDELLADF